MVQGRLQLLCACALLLALLAVLAADAQQGPGVDPACDVFAAPAALGGDDDNAGTSVQAPVTTISRLLAIVPGGSGEESRGVACVRGGTYDFSSSLEATLDKPWTTLRPYNDEAATLVGRLVISVTARHAVVEGLTLNGWRPGQPDSPSLVIFGDAASVRDNTITNDGTAICVHVSDYRGDRARDVTIAGNEVHGCGAIEHLNHDNGIYVANADGTRILDNVVRDNQDRGIQLWPDADGSLVEGNVVDHNGEGISVGGERRPGADLSSDDNTIRGNVIMRSRANYADPDGAGPIQANTHGWNLEFVRNDAGSGNLVEDNCFFADHPDPYYATNAGINLADSGGVPVSFALGPNAVLGDEALLASTSYETIGSACAETRDGLPGADDESVARQPGGGRLRGHRAQGPCERRGRRRRAQRRGRLGLPLRRRRQRRAHSARERRGRLELRRSELRRRPLRRRLRRHHRSRRRRLRDGAVPRPLAALRQARRRAGRARCRPPPRR